MKKRKVPRMANPRELLCVVCDCSFIGYRGTSKVCGSFCRSELTKIRANKYYSDNIDVERIKRKYASRSLCVNSPETRLLAGAKSRAKKDGLPFDLKLSDIIIPDLCPIFNVPLVRNTWYAPSIDKIIPSKGYVKNNIQIISKKANTMKGDASIKELQEFAQWVLKNYPL